MKQATKWLLAAAATAILLVPQAAWAQKKKPPPPPTTPPPAPPAGGAAGGDTLEIDDPNQPKAPDPNAAGGTNPPANPDPNAAGGTGGAAGGTGGICEIDPSACPKVNTDLKASAAKDVNAEVYAVQQIYALRYHRIELMPYWNVTLNDQFVNHPGPGLGANFYITNVLAIGLNGNFYQGLNSDSDFNFQNRRATRVAVPLNEYQVNANLNFTYVPIYGKFAGFSDFIFHYDAYVVGGVGFNRTRPEPVIDPDNRNFDWNTNIVFNAGLGLRIFFNRWFAADMEVRNYGYVEKLENLSIAQAQTGPNSQADPKTWYGENKFTVNVQAQLGISVFLPFSWEYRLPK